MMQLIEAERFAGLTCYGKREWGIALSLSLLVAVVAVAAGSFLNYTFGACILALLSLVAGVAVALFFRDPQRTPTETELILLSPADGVVRDLEVTPVPEGDAFAGQQKARRIGIFLSVLNVHINRAPCDWVIKERIYREGHYHDARNPLAGKENEALLLGGEASVSGKRFPMSVRQVSGAIARRIVCAADPGHSLTLAQRYGMIKFGSRTEVYLPIDDELVICVKPGDAVRAGLTVIARLKAPEADGGMNETC